MIQWKRDVIYGIVIDVFAVILFVNSFTIVEGTVRLKMAQPGAYMRAWLLLLFVLGTVIIIRALMKKVDTAVTGSWHVLPAVTVLLVLGYVLLLPYLGFSICTFAFLFILTIFYTKSNSVAKHSDEKVKVVVIKCVVFSLIMTFLTDWIFSDILTVVLPRVSLFG